MEVVIKKGGIIELPKMILSELGLTIGKKVDIRIKDHELMIRPVEKVTNKITDSIKLHDTKLIEAIIENEDWL